MRFPIQMESSKEESLSIISNKDLSIQIMPPDANDSGQVIVTSVLETSRKSQSSVSEFRMLFHHQKKSLSLIPLGPLAHF